jgi:hypothetical protein
VDAGELGGEKGDVKNRKSLRADDPLYEVALLSVIKYL